MERERESDLMILHEPSEYFQKVNFRYLFCCFFFVILCGFFVGFRPKHGLVPQILEFLYFIKMNIYGSCTERQRKVKWSRGGNCTNLMSLLRMD